MGTAITSTFFYLSRNPFQIDYLLLGRFKIVHVWIASSYQDLKRKSLCGVGTLIEHEIFSTLV